MGKKPEISYMSLALQLAERGRFTVSPNPMVGCIIVKNHRIVGQGWHQYAGGPHAEVYALQEAGREAKGASAYISLEPCCHVGKTPPCVNALIEAGISHVHVACVDPNPLVSGQGIKALEQAGIKVMVGECEQEAKEQNKIFFHFMKYKRPYVIAKWAMSLDGKTITHKDDSRQISGEESLYHAHSLRQSVDAIIIGSKTAIQDNPRLTVRTGEKVVKQPLRLILSTDGELPLDLNIFDVSLPNKTILVTTSKLAQSVREKAKEKRIETLICAMKEGAVDLEDLLLKLGQLGITSLLVEGGETVHASFFKDNLINQMYAYIAPKIISQLPQKKTVSDLKISYLGQDIVLEAGAGE